MKHRVEVCIVTEEPPVDARAGLAPDDLAIVRKQFSNMEKLGSTIVEFMGVASPHGNEETRRLVSLWRQPAFERRISFRCAAERQGHFLEKLSCKRISSDTSNSCKHL